MQKLQSIEERKRHKTLGSAALLYSCSCEAANSFYHSLSVTFEDKNYKINKVSLYNQV